MLSGCASSSNKDDNMPPKVSAFCDNTPLNTNLMGDLSASVTDSDSPLLNFTLINQAAQGVATIDPTGLFTYIPNPDSRGTDRASPIRSMIFRVALLTPP